MRTSSLVYRVSLTAWLFLSAAFAPGVAVAEPTTADLTTAHAATEDGLSKRALGDHAGALKSFEAAHALLGTPATGLDVALEQEALGLLVEALYTAQSVASSAATGAENEFTKNAAQALSERISPRIGAIKVGVRGVDAGTALRLQIDESEIPTEAATGPRRINPGEHTIELGADGYDSVRQTVQVMESVTVTIEALLVASEAGGDAQRASPDNSLAYW